MIIQYTIVAIFFIFTFAKRIMLIENFNSLTFNSQGWKCLPSNTNSVIYQCNYGMYLVQLSKECNNIGNTFINIPPHFSIQLYVDFIAYRSIDENEQAYIKADNANIYTYYNLQAGYLQYSNQCESSDERFSMITSVTEFSHSNTQLIIEFSTNLDEGFNNEGYPFRNLQLYISQCHYTCKTCLSEAYNSCLSCFTQNSSPTLQQCQTCKDQQNLRFLLTTQGCLQECPDGYSYDQELVCQRNISKNLVLNRIIISFKSKLNSTHDFLGLPFDFLNQFTIKISFGLQCY